MPVSAMEFSGSSGPVDKSRCGCRAFDNRRDVMDVRLCSIGSGIVTREGT